MRYPASEKLEIIRLVEQSSLPVRRTLTKLGIPRATFYRWYDRYSGGGPEALTDRSPRPDRVWNRIPDDVRQRIIQMAIQEPALSQPRIGDPVQCRRRDDASERAADAIALVVGHDQKHVGRALRGYDRGRPVRFGIDGGVLDHATKLRVGRRDLFSVNRSGGAG